MSWHDGAVGRTGTLPLLLMVLHTCEVMCECEPHTHMTHDASNERTSSNLNLLQSDTPRVGYYIYIIGEISPPVIVMVVCEGSARVARWHPGRVGAWGQTGTERGW